MNILYLKYICEVEKYGSISKAANHLYINQPRLSKIIKDFEKDLNFKIFERTSQGVIPTKRGLLFLKQAKVIINEVQNLENLSMQNHQVLSLDLCVPRASYISTVFVDFLNELNMDNQYIRMNYHETNSLEAIKNVFEGNDHLGIIRFPIEDEKYYLNIFALKELNYQDLFEFKYHLLMSKDNPLVNKNIHFDDLKDQIELIHGDIALPDLPLSFTNQIQEKISTNRVINIYERGSQFEILAKLKNSYMWVSPMPKENLKRFELIQKECIDFEMKCKDILIYRKGYRMSEEEKIFIKMLKGTIKDL